MTRTSTILRSLAPLWRAEVGPTEVSTSTKYRLWMLKAASSFSVLLPAKAITRRFLRHSTWMYV